jgi:hypothetical protein
MCRHVKSGRDCRWCARPPVTLWISVYPVGGGEKVTKKSTVVKIARSATQETVETFVRNAAKVTAEECELSGDYVAIYRHCVTGTPSYCMLFTVKRADQPIEVTIK